MLKFLLKEVRANSSGNGSRGISSSGRNNGRASNIGGDTNSTGSRAEGMKRKGLTGDKGKSKSKPKKSRPSNLNI